MNYEIFDGFLADAENSVHCWILIGGQWIEVFDWRDRYVEHGLLWCRARILKAGPHGEFFKTLICLSDIQAVQSDAP